MVWIKSCPRCEQGDMYLDEDDCEHCMQCGFVSVNRAALNESRWFGAEYRARYEIAPAGLQLSVAN